MADSKAAYIILCGGRIEVAAAPNGIAQIVAASNTARRLTTFYGDRVSGEDTQPISDLQHYMMDNMKTMKKAEVAEKIAEMFALLDALEEKIGG